MSDQPKRFDPIIDDDGLPAMDQFREGDYVLFSDYARLQAEVEAYKPASDEVAAAFLALPAPHNQVGRVVEGIESLKAEVERLRKAGDAMEASLSDIPTNDHVKGIEAAMIILEWRAAKDGKPIGCRVNPNKVAQYMPKPNTAKDGNATK